MKVWVTGASGMLGRDVIESLRRWKIPHVGSGREVDIADPGAVGEFVSLHTPTHVVNCAAFTGVDDAEAAGELASRVNALGPEVLGTAAAALGATVVHYSTDYVFAGTATRPYTEQDDPGPINVYGLSKLEGERRLRQACPASFVVRTSWLFGVGGPNFVATMLQLMSEREDLHVVDDQHGRPTYAPDLVDASLSLAGIGPRAALRPDFGIYHFANAGEVTWHGLATGVREAARRRGLPMVTRRIHPVSTDAAPRPAARPRRAALDTRRIERVLARSPRPWAAALEAYLDQRREHRDERAG